MTSSWSLSRFQTQMGRAMDMVRKLLENQRSPQLPLDVPHQYGDKFLCAEFVTKTAIAAHLNCLECFGLKNRDQLLQLKKWSENRSVTIRFRSEERCTFDREVKREVESKDTHVREYSGTFVHGTRTDKTITTVTEYYWKFIVDYELFAYEGNNPDKKETLTKRSEIIELKTSSSNPPRPQNSVIPPMDCNITWLLQRLNESATLDFTINREVKACKTPTRNPEVDTALIYFADFHSWSNKVENYIRNQLFPVQTSYTSLPSYEYQKISDSSVFVPVLALFERPDSTKVAIKDKISAAPGSNLGLLAKYDNSSPVLSIGDINSFLTCEMKTLQDKFADLGKTFPDKEGLITLTEAKLIVTLQHLRQISQHHSDGIFYIEHMLYEQFRQAIGREVTPNDFVEYMLYHNRLLFKPEFEPAPFCYAVRRTGRTPEGYVELLAHDGKTIPAPIRTISHVEKHGTPVQFPINASTNISFTGERILHAFVAHQFEDNLNLHLQLVARARQFSCFIVLIGKIATADIFEPKYAALVQNKDNLGVPLTFELIPPPKQFAAAVSSISPEQQRFAKAYRSMQLGGTLFGICVLQIKPQLERLLNLPPDSLTKEIRLTQDLLELFIKYQIPSDLLTYDGTPSVSIQIKLNTVKHYVQQMQDMIKEAKQNELVNAMQKNLFNVLSAAVEGVEVEYGGSRAVRPGLPPQRRPAAPADAPAEPASPAMEVDECEEELNDYCAPPQSICADEAPSFSCSSRSMMEEEVCLDEISVFSRISQDIISPDYSEKRRRRRSISPEIIPISAPNPRVKELETKLQEQKDKLAAQIAKHDKDVTQLNKEIDIGKAKVAQLEEALRVALLPPEDAPELPVEDEGPAQTRLDFTKYPGMLDSRFEKFDEDSALRATIINPGTTWSKQFQTGLLSPPSSVILNATEQEQERNKAFDLLDALTRSGVLPIKEASLHVVLAATHCFDKSIIDTIVQDNMNPIEKLERSTLIVATTITGKTVEELVNAEQLERVSTYHQPLLLK